MIGYFFSCGRRIRCHSILPVLKLRTVVPSSEASVSASVRRLARVLSLNASLTFCIRGILISNGLYAIGYNLSIVGKIMQSVSNLDPDYELVYNRRTDA